MEIFLVILLIVGVLLVLYQQLLQQSKKPSGWLGSMMMKLWNNVYLPLAKWCLVFVEEREKDQISSVLDVGVGNGASTNYIREFFTKADHIVGIDISQKAVEQARKYHLTANIRFEKKDISQTGYPSNQFDLICAFQNHFHWEDLQGSFLEIRRILSANGILLIGCEYAKISYFLPGLKEIHSFESFLNKLGLKLIQTEHKADWIFYKIKKAD
jgi:SAM-dependent methyltransferase